MADQLFNTVERIQGDRPWGSVLDAGTGVHSLRWITGLETTRWTAITGDARRETRLLKEKGVPIRMGDRVLTGNWTDPTLLHGEVYDVVIADYLLGALEGFAPYFQDRLFERLRPHVGGQLYVIGLAPYPPADSEGSHLIWEIARLRDACILLAGHRCYREYPMDWVVRAMERAGFTVQEATAMPILYGPRFINGQLDVCARKLPYFKDRALAQSMDAHITALRVRALEHLEQSRHIRFGEDYVIAAVPTG